MRRAMSTSTYQVSLLDSDDSDDDSSPRECAPTLRSAPRRVRAAVRLRPAFAAEVDAGFVPAVELPDSGPIDGLSEIVLRLPSGKSAKQRSFFFDTVFGSSATQCDVYRTAASPVVLGVLDGLNGSVLAYGQTGTGKTFTMGLLERIVDGTQPNSGIVARALAQIFDELGDRGHNQKLESWSVSMSFLQIYLEALQDLLASPSGGERGGEQAPESLPIREDPSAGFYVEGLREYAVTSFGEAVDLLNVGLENRNMASTLMNTTSSRSHTVLSVVVEQRRREGNDGGAVRLRSKLLLVDLAGSERVRRTTSKGTRLLEARSINVSLSALGNVIAALADERALHVPFRDSKLTRLLQGSLGGHANTVLVATVGPAPASASETLSTLLFASRCMHVKAAPVVNREVDYADLCARLQLKLAGVEREWMRREAAMRDRYEAELREIRTAHQLRGAFPTAVASSSSSLSSADEASSSASNVGGCSSILGELGAAAQSTNATVELDVLRRCYRTLLEVSEASTTLLREADRRKHKMQREWHEVEERDAANERAAQQEEAHLMSFDPILAAAAASGGQPVHPGQFGPHLAPLARSEARRRAEARFPTDDGEDRTRLLRIREDSFRPLLEAAGGGFSSRDLDAHLRRLRENVAQRIAATGRLLVSHDKRYVAMKHELVEQSLERRQREEELVNWSYVLKYLLSTNSRLRQELRQMQSQMVRAGSRGGDVPQSTGVSKERRKADGTASAFRHARNPSLADSSTSTAPSPLRYEEEEAFSQLDNQEK